jgi:hypothetical protein
MVGMSHRRAAVLAVTLLAAPGCGLVLEAPGRRDASRGEDADRPDAPSLDAPGLDAFALDAAMPDAPLLDAPLLDAPLLDAPLLDAPLLDAPLPDAPLPDAFALDAFAPDAPMPDAFAPDAFVLDARPFDAFVPPVDAFAPPEELIAHYPFHGVDDMTGRGHTLAIAGVSFSGRVAVFAVGSTASTPDAPDLDAVQAISLWLRPSTLPAGTGRATLVDSQGRFLVSITSTGLACSHGGGLGITVGVPLEVGGWRFVACMFTGSGINGFVGGGISFSGSGGAVPPLADEPLVLGRTIRGEQIFQGGLADVRIWRRTPTSAELVSLASTPP